MTLPLYWDDTFCMSLLEVVAVYSLTVSIAPPFTEVDIISANSATWNILADFSNSSANFRYEAG